MIIEKFFNSEDYGLHWGCIPIYQMPRHEPEVVRAMGKRKKVFEPLVPTGVVFDRRL